MKTEVVRYSKTSATISKSTWYNISEDLNLHQHSWKNLKSHNVYLLCHEYCCLHYT
jgi:hypothetical protein